MDTLLGILNNFYKDKGLPEVTIQSIAVETKAVVVDGKAMPILDLISDVVKGKYVVSNPEAVREISSAGYERILGIQNIRKYEGYSKIILIVEDRVSGNIFYENLLRNLFPFITLIPKRKEVGKGWNNLAVVEYIKNEIKCEDFSGNYYIIMLDNPRGNAGVNSLYSSLKRRVKGFRNIFLVPDYSGIESVLLSFEELIEWVSLQREISSDEEEVVCYIRNYMKQKSVKNYKTLVGTISRVFPKMSGVYSVERICSYVLSSITKTTKFLTNKSRIGYCWYCDCCKFKDNCGLGKSSIEKSEDIYRKSCISGVF